MTKLYLDSEDTIENSETYWNITTTYENDIEVIYHITK